MKENIKLEINPGSDELIIREGRAPDIQQPQQVYINCNLASLINYIVERDHFGLSQEETAGDDTNPQIFKPDKTIFLVDLEKLTLTIDVDPQTPTGTKIIGSLEYNPDFTQFGINKNQTFTRDQLIKLIRFNRRFFQSVEQHETLLKSLSNLDILTSGHLQADSDNRGNKLQSFAKTANAKNVPLDFILNIPIFKGTTPVLIRTEVCFDVSESTVKFWLESFELPEITENLKQKMFDEVLATVTDNYCVLYR